MHTCEAEAEGCLPCGKVLKRGEASQAAPPASAQGLPPPPGLKASTTVTERDPLWRDSVSTSPGSAGCAADQALQALPQMVPRLGLQTAPMLLQVDRAATVTAEWYCFSAPPTPQHSGWSPQNIQRTLTVETLDPIPPDARLI